MKTLRLIASTFNNQLDETEIEDIIYYKVSRINDLGRSCFVVCINIRYDHSIISKWYKNYYILQSLSEIWGLIGHLQRMRESNQPEYGCIDIPNFMFLEVDYRRYLNVKQKTTFNLSLDRISIALYESLYGGYLTIYRDKVTYSSKGVTYSKWLNDREYYLLNRELFSAQYDAFKVIIDEMKLEYDELLSYSSTKVVKSFVDPEDVIIFDQFDPDPYSRCDYARANKLQLVKNDVRFILSDLLDKEFWIESIDMPENEFVIFAENLIKYRKFIV